MHHYPNSWKLLVSSSKCPLLELQIAAFLVLEGVGFWYLFPLHMGALLVSIQGSTLVTSFNPVFPLN